MNNPIESKSKPVTFRCRTPTARKVMLAGNFNGWKPEATPMKRDADGNWTATLNLIPGRYEYKFVVDGRWCCEPGKPDAYYQAADVVPNPLGTANRLMEVR